MPKLFLDLETRGALPLPDVGVSRYARDMLTDVLLIGYAIDDGPVEVVTPTDPIAEPFALAAACDNWQVIGHNVQFDATIYDHVLVPRYGYLPMPMQRWRCTMAMCLAAGRPAALDKACKALGLPGKDPAGYKAAMSMSKPRKAKRGEDPAGVYWHDTPELRALATGYLKGDVANCRTIYNTMPRLSDFEQEVWQLDFAINRRGFPIDVKLATAAQKIVEAERAAINAELVERTGGAITSVHQVSRFKALLTERGHKVTALNKRNVSALLAHKPAADVEKILRLRQEGGRAAAHKLATLLASVDEDHRLRGCYRYHGAATGRWSSRGYQAQNLQKSSLVDLEGVIAAIRSGDVERVRTFGPPIEIIGAASRAMIRVPAS